MQTIKVEIEDSKVDIVLNIIKNLKDDVITKNEFINDEDTKRINKFLEIIC